MDIFWKWLKNEHLNYIHVCKHTQHIHAHTRMHARTHARTHAHTHTHTHTHMHIHMHADTYASTPHADMHSSTSYTSTPTHVHTYTQWSDDVLTFSLLAAIIGQWWKWKCPERWPCNTCTYCCCSGPRHVSNVLDITFSGVGKPFLPCMKIYMGGFVQPFGWPASCGENIMFAQNALNTEQLPQKVLHHGRLCLCFSCWNLVMWNTNAYRLVNIFILIQYIIGAIFWNLFSVFFVRGLMNNFTMAEIKPLPE